MRSRITAIALTLTLLSGGAHAQSGGYFDFTQVPGLGEPHVQIDLNSQMLGFFGVLTGTTDPELADALAGIKNIRVLSYDTLEDAEAVLEFVADSSGKLEAAGWQRIVYVEDGGERVRVYAKLEGQNMVGLTVMVVDTLPKPEATFINIAGDIDPAQLGRIAGEVGVDGFFDGVAAAEAAAEADAEGE